MKLETQFLHFETRFVRGLSMVLSLYVQVVIAMFREVIRFSKSFRVAKYKNAVSWNSRLSFCISKLDFFEAWVLFRFCLFTEHSLSLPNLSRKIDGPLLAGYKLIYNNFFKDRSFQWYLVLDILTNPVRVTLTKKVTFWGISLFTYYSLKTKFAPFLKS